MYPNLKRLLQEKHVNSEMYAALLGCSKSSAINKIAGKNDHTLKEAKAAMTIFPEYSFDYVFSVEDK